MVPQPPVLYHYTDWDAAEGILSSREFWFTAHDCTNDCAELESADQLTIQAAKDLRSDANDLECLLIDRFISEYVRLRITKLAGPIYLACFSTARDSSSQWDRYARQGRGLCLGLKVLPDETAPDNLPVAVSLHRVEYSEWMAQKRVRKAFQAVCRSVSRVETQEYDELQQSLRLGLSAMYRIAAFAAVSTKRPQWAEECEWRQVALRLPDQDVKLLLRHSARGAIRYLSLPLRQRGRPLALSEILIGPNQDPNAAYTKALGLLSKAGYPSPYAELPKITVASSAAVRPA